MRLLAVLVLALAAPALAADAPKGSGMDEKTRQQVLGHVLERPINELDPTVTKAFLAMDLDVLPKKQRDKAKARKLEIETVVKLHGVKTRKRGNMLQVPAACDPAKAVKELGDWGAYGMAGYVEVFEDEAERITKDTNCTEQDMLCEFSLIIFRDPARKKPRRLGFHQNDPLMALVGGYRGKAGGNTKFFGLGGITCMH